MAAKQNSTTNKKEGEITRQDRNSVTQQAELTLQEIKKKAGDVVLIAINNRTTIELPAYLSQAEIDARVANYIRLHKTNMQ